MSIIEIFDGKARKAWDSFVQEENLSAKQAKQFERYMELLDEWNAITNITRITEPEDVINLHFRDSLALVRARDLSLCKGLCDVGSGGGFPGIPLAICFPEMPVFLLEVSQKKRAFLSTVINELQLSLCQVLGEDYLTFIRTTAHPIDFFVARASLQAEVLVKALNAPNYTRAEIVYWASQHWQAEGAEKKYLVERFAYELDGQPRFLAFFKRNL